MNKYLRKPKEKAKATIIRISHNTMIRARSDLERSSPRIDISNAKSVRIRTGTLASSH